MKYHLCLISSLFFISLLLGCSNKKKIIWSDYRSDEKNEKIELMFGKNNTTAPIRKNVVISDFTNYIIIPNGYSLIGQSHDSGFCVHVYPTSYSKIDKFEIFLYDTRKISKEQSRYTVDKKENVLAYFLDCYDVKNKKHYTIVSKDNFFYNRKIEMRNTKTIIEILDVINKNDYAFYTDDDYYQDMPYNGYIVKSNIDGSIIWLSSRDVY